MKRINVGIVGIGLLGNIHAMSLMTLIEEEVFKGVADIRIAGFADINEKTLHDRGELYDVTHLTTDGHELCKSDNIDAIYIVTPTKHHHEFFMSAARNKKHVFVEKPVGTNEHIKEMIRARDENDIISQVGLVLRYEPFFWYLKHLADEKKDEFGPLQNVLFRDDQQYPYTGTGTHPSTWRADKEMAYHGTLFEHSIHDLDQLIRFCGKVTLLSAIVKFFNGKEGIEDSASVLMDFEDGSTASLNSIWYGAKQDSRLCEFFFKNAYMVLETGFLGQGSIRYRIGNEKVVKVQGEDISRAFFKHVFPGLNVPAGLPYFYENVAFMRSIISGQPAHPGLETALYAHEIIEKCYESSNNKKLITL